MVTSLPNVLHTTSNITQPVTVIERMVVNEGGGEGGVSLFDAALLWLWLKINFSFCSLQSERSWVAPSNDQPVAEKRHDGVRSVLFTFHSARQHRNHDVEKPYGDNMKESACACVSIIPVHHSTQPNTRLIKFRMRQHALLFWMHPSVNALVVRR